MAGAPHAELSDTRVSADGRTKRVIFSFRFALDDDMERTVPKIGRLGHGRS